MRGQSELHWHRGIAYQVLADRRGRDIPAGSCHGRVAAQFGDSLASYPVSQARIIEMFNAVKMTRAFITWKAPTEPDRRGSSTPAEASTPSRSSRPIANAAPSSMTARPRRQGACHLSAYQRPSSHPLLPSMSERWTLKPSRRTVACPPLGRGNGGASPSEQRHLSAGRAGGLDPRPARAANALAVDEIAAGSPYDAADLGPHWMRWPSWA